MRIVQSTSVMDIPHDRIMEEYDNLYLTLYRISQTNPDHGHLLHGVVASVRQILRELHKTYEEDAPVKTICVWCGRLLNGDQDATVVTHGICADCFKAQEDEIADKYL